MDKVDILNREKFLQQLIQLTENISANKKSTSFAINGVWGCGKSFILDMFEEQLSQIQSEETADKKYFIVRYNCWKYDYYEEPLIAIVAALLDAIDQNINLLSGENGSKIKGILKAVGAIFSSAANDAIKSKTNIDLRKAWDIVKNGINLGEDTYQKTNEYDIYFGFKQSLKGLQNAINEFTKQYTVVLLVDELDRCLPEYAIKVLERLHHLIEEQSNIITIISIDKEQLISSIKQILIKKLTEQNSASFL